MQLASANRPRSPTSSATWAYASGYRRYHRTAVMITSPEYWRPLNLLVAVIGIKCPPYQRPLPNFATEPRRRYRVPITKDNVGSPEKLRVHLAFSHENMLFRCR